MEEDDDDKEEFKADINQDITKDIPGIIDIDDIGDDDNDNDNELLFGQKKQENYGYDGERIVDFENLLDLDTVNRRRQMAQETDDVIDLEDLKDVKMDDNMINDADDPDNYNDEELDMYGYAHPRRNNNNINDYDIEEFNKDMNEINDDSDIGDIDIDIDEKDKDKKKDGNKDEKKDNEKKKDDGEIDEDQLLADVKEIEADGGLNDNDNIDGKITSWENDGIQADEGEYREISEKFGTQLWKEPIVTANVIASFIDQFPNKFKEKIWNNFTWDLQEDGTLKQPKEPYVYVPEPKPEPRPEPKPDPELTKNNKNNNDNTKKEETKKDDDKKKDENKTKIDELENLNPEAKKVKDKDKDKNKDKIDDEKKEEFKPEPRDIENELKDIDKKRIPISNLDELLYTFFVLTIRLKAQICDNNNEPNIPTRDDSKKVLKKYKEYVLKKTNNKELNWDNFIDITTWMCDLDLEENGGWDDGPQIIPEEEPYDAENAPEIIKEFEEQKKREKEEEERIAQLKKEGKWVEPKLIDDEPLPEDGIIGVDNSHLDEEAIRERDEAKKAEQDGKNKKSGGDDDDNNNNINTEGIILDDEISDTDDENDKKDPDGDANDAVDNIIKSEDIDKKEDDINKNEENIDDNVKSENIGGHIDEMDTNKNKDDIKNENDDETNDIE